MSRLLPLSLALLLAIGGIGSARAQSAPGVDKAVLPVWNNASGKVEAVLVLEPTSAAEAGGMAAGNSRSRAPSRADIRIGPGF